jgi:hypothetical protein
MGSALAGGVRARGAGAADRRPGAAHDRQTAADLLSHHGTGKGSRKGLEVLEATRLLAMIARYALTAGQTLTPRRDLWLRRASARHCRCDRLPATRENTDIGQSSSLVVDFDHLESHLGWTKGRRQEAGMLEPNAVLDIIAHLADKLSLIRNYPSQLRTVDCVGYASSLASVRAYQPGFRPLRSGAVLSFVAFPNREYCELVRELYGARDMPSALK